MHISVASLLLGALTLARRSFAQVDCEGNIAISDLDVAKNVRDSCTIIEGQVVFKGNFTGDINLDGVEIIKGGMAQSGCAHCTDEEDPRPKPFKITSSTLREVNDDIYLWTPKGLSHLLLPKLRIVNGTISIGRAEDLIELDLTKLEYAAGFSIEAENLEKLHIDDFKGFNTIASKHGNPSYSLSVGNVDSVDGFFKNPIDPLVTNNTINNYNNLNLRAGPNLKKITLGWTRVPELAIIGGDDLTVVLGGPETKSMTIESLKLYGNAKIERGPVMRNLSVGRIDVSYESTMTDLDLPFDQVSWINLYSSYNLRSVTLPPQAVDWRGLGLEISACFALDLFSQYDDAGEQTWYWPKEMDTIMLRGNISMEFFETFFDQDTKVARTFAIEDYSGQVSCEALDEQMNKTVGGEMSDFKCQVYNASGPLSRMVNWTLQTGLMALAVGYLA